jgi:hypothetical protein
MILIGEKDLIFGVWKLKNFIYAPQIEIYTILSKKN